MVLIVSDAVADSLPKADANFAPIDFDQVRLGQLLLYDPILSKSNTVACTACHHPKHAIADGVSLGLGDGAHGIGPNRTVDRENLSKQRVPRRAPALFNLGFNYFTIIFHDDRLEADPTWLPGIRTPFGAEMVNGFA